ncbi:MAG TPA: 3-methyladenine DNA glycosylase [Dermatophilaceae bacterium]|nr:3-methyladenine DNA glycosylase [Dermatophilaceae bacterium]
MTWQKWPAPEWRALVREHERSVDALTAGFLQRRSRGVAHPVEDFLFVYYRHSPARLRRWHPGPGVLLLHPEAPPGPSVSRAGERAGWPYYLTTEGGVGLDLECYLARRGTTVRFVRDLLAATSARSPYLGCWGLHEWAMVYRADPDQLRHAGWPLRLGPAGTDRVVEAHQIRCSHADAYRFFTAAAAPRNLLHPSRATQLHDEQPGCLHATMDLYKWAHKLAPGIPSDLTLACFELARDARELDMRAGPYDLTDLGYPPTTVETADGKAEYAQRQRELASRGDRLRRRLTDACETILAGRRSPPGKRHTQTLKPHLPC